MAKVLLALCASVLLVQTAVGQCWGRGLAAPCGRIGYAGYGAYGAGCGYGAAADIAAASSLNAAWGGSLGVTSASPVPPTGLNVVSDNVYEGALAVGGNMPFLGTAAVDGAFPSAGAGGVSYGCGDGAVGITAEEVAPGYAGIGYSGLGYAGLGYNGLGYAGLGYGGLGYAGRLGGCGYGGLGLVY